MMPRMLDLIRNSQVPSNLMQSAVRGALSVPPAEMIEILVYLAVHHKLFGERARLTLAGWDEKASLAAAADPKTSSEVLGYLVSPENLRPCLLLALAENPSVSEESLDALALSGSRSTVEVLLSSSRLMNSAGLLQALLSNPSLRPNEQAEVGKKLAGLETTAAPASTGVDAPDEVVDVVITKYLDENAAELELEKNKPFLPIGIAPEGITHERRVSEVPVDEVAVETTPPPAAAGVTASTAEGQKPAPNAAAKAATV